MKKIGNPRHWRKWTVDQMYEFMASEFDPPERVKAEDIKEKITDILLNYTGSPNSRLIAIEIFKFLQANYKIS